MILFQRHEWGSKHSGGSVVLGPKKLVLVHHTALPDIACGTPTEEVHKAIRGIEHHHVVKNGWSAIGYNWLITQAGHVYEGRGWDRSGAHAGNQTDNKRSVGICFTIDGAKHMLTEAAADACRELIQEGLDTGRIASDYAIQGHRDVRQTNCPGDLIYGILQTLRP